METDYFLMGNSVSDRTNRITLIKLVAQKLNVDRTGHVDFFLKEDNVIIRKGDGEYNPAKLRDGFYMGSSVVDKDNRITMIKLVVQNLQIKEEDKIEFFLHDNEVVIRKVADVLKDFDPEETSKECHEAAAWMYINYSSKIADYVAEHFPEKPDEDTKVELFKQTKEKADSLFILDALTDADLERLPIEIAHIEDQLRNNTGLAMEYIKKYSETYKESSNNIVEPIMSSEELYIDSQSNGEGSAYSQPTVMPKKRAIKSLFSKKKK